MVVWQKRFAVESTTFSEQKKNEMHKQTFARLGVDNP
jgi:hypothetical protein